MTGADQLYIGHLPAFAQTVMRRFVDLCRVRDPRAQRVTAMINSGRRPSWSQLAALLDGPAPRERPALRLVLGGKVAP